MQGILLQIGCFERGLSRRFQTVNFIFLSNCKPSKCHWHLLVHHLLVRHSYVLVCQSHVTRMYSYVIRISLVSTRLSFVCHSYVFACHLYVTRIYSYFIRMSLVCTRLPSVCHSYVVLP